MAEKQSGKKPIFKKAWFWVIIAVIVIIGAIIAGNNNQPTKIGESGNSSQTESTNGDFKTGDIIKIDEQEVSVVAADMNYATGKEYIKAADGKKYVKIDVQIKNTSNDKISYNVLYWEIEDESGDITSYSAMAQADDGLGSGDLAAGGTKKGSIVFEVSDSSAKFKIHYKPNMWSSKEAVINL